MCDLEKSLREAAEHCSNKAVGAYREFESHPLRDQALIYNVLRVIFNLPPNLPPKIKCGGGAF